VGATPRGQRQGIRRLVPATRRYACYNLKYTLPVLVRGFLASVRRPLNRACVLVLCVGADYHCWWAAAVEAVAPVATPEALSRPFSPRPVRLAPHMDGLM